MQNGVKGQTGVTPKHNVSKYGSNSSRLSLSPVFLARRAQSRTESSSSEERVATAYRHYLSNYILQDILENEEESLLNVHRNEDTSSLGTIWVKGYPKIHVEYLNKDIIEKSRNLNETESPYCWSKDLVTNVEFSLEWQASQVLHVLDKVTRKLLTRNLYLERTMDPAHLLFRSSLSDVGEFVRNIMRDNPVIIATTYHRLRQRLLEARGELISGTKELIPSYQQLYKLQMSLELSILATLRLKPNSRTEDSTLSLSLQRRFESAENCLNSKLESSNMRIYSLS